ncbi:MAG: fumarylacetoacetate hydrolase family protein [Opitutaceae bacterium]|nr:fumarylacetoacetate hydrolase family protein [Cytophagales bacterium]
MKIICVGRNYAAHIEELNSERPVSPVIFLKPDTALLRNNLPFYYPEFSKEIHYECELVIRICKEGRHIAERFAPTYYDQVGLGVDFTARDLQNNLKDKGLPWELCKAFDHSAVISKFIPKENFKDLQNINFSFFQNGIKKQEVNTSQMLFKIDEIVTFVSQYFTFKIGDLIFTGTPAGVGEIKIGDRLSGRLENELMFDFAVK